MRSFTIVNGSQLPPRPFELTFTPAEVIRDFTKDIRLECGYDGKTASQVRHVSRVRLLQKSVLGWTQVAEVNWHNLSLRAIANEHPGSRPESLLKFNWEIASGDVLGVYRCDVIGFDKMANSVIVSTAEVELPDVDLLTFLLDVRDYQKREIELLKQEIVVLKASSVTDRLEVESTQNSVSNLNMKVDDVSEDVDNIKGGITSLMEAVYKNISAIREDFSDDILSLNSSLDLQREEIVSLLSSDLHSVEGQISTLNTRLTSANQSFTDLSQQLDAVNVNIGSVEGNVTYVKDQVLELQENVSHYKKSVQSLRDSVHENINQVRQDLKAIESKVSSSFANLSVSDIAGPDTSADFNSIKQELASISSNVSTLSRDVTNVNQNVSSLALSLNGELSALRTGIVSVQLDVKSVKDEILSTHETMRRNDQSVSFLKRDLLCLENNFTSLRENVTTLKEEVDSNTVQIASNGEIITSQDSELKTVTKQVAGIGKDISSLNSEFTINRREISMLKVIMKSSAQELLLLSTELGETRNEVGLVGDAVISMTTNVSYLHSIVAVTKADGDSIKMDLASIKKEANDFMETVAAMGKEMMKFKADLCFANNNYTTLTEKFYLCSRSFDHSQRRFCHCERNNVLAQ